MLLLARAVAAGHGLAVLPRRSIADGAADVELKRLREPRMQRRLIAVARASALTRPVVGTVLAELVAAAR
jgi:DNA-binding transcriptional LysR family regulator